MGVIEAHSKVVEWRHDPFKFLREVLQVERLDPWQEGVIRDYADPKKQRIAMQACAGPGKSAVLAWCGWHFLSCFAEHGYHPNGAAMSVTADNLRDNLWKEFAVWRGRSDFLKHGFDWNKERIVAKDFPETWFIAARSWSRTASAEDQGRTLSGLHSKFILYLVDESGDIAAAIGRAAEQGLSNCVWGKIMQAGNPTTLGGMLHTAATKQRHLWSLHRITGDPDDPNRSPRINIEWAREQIAEHGRDNAWVKAFILGQFPPSSINTLLSPDEVEAAMRRALKPAYYDFAQKRVGVDVARFGDDRTILFPRQGLAAFEPIVMRNARGPEIAARVAHAYEKWQHELTYVDDTGGYGASVIDALYQAQLSHVPVSFSGKSDDPRYFNRRSEMWFRMAEWVKRGGWLPNLPELVRELTTPVYTFDAGKFRLEEKDQIKKRLGFSPDMADALALTFAHVEAPARAPHPALEAERTRMKSDYDPFSDERHA